MGGDAFLAPLPQQSAAACGGLESDPAGSPNGSRRTVPTTRKSATRTTLPAPAATSAAGGHPTGRGFRVA